MCLLVNGQRPHSVLPESNLLPLHCQIWVSYFSRVEEMEDKVTVKPCLNLSYCATLESRNELVAAQGTLFLSQTLEVSLLIESTFTMVSRNSGALLL
jgi:hypothetical protein